MNERDTNDGGYIPPQPGQPKKKSKGCGCLAGAAVLIVIVAAIAVAAGGGSNNAASSGTTVTDTGTAAAAPLDTSVAAPADTTQAAPTVAAQVTYACTGSAPDGVDVTYGPSGSQYSASKLPFSKTVPLDASAQYYVTEAQLSGSGQVTCTTTIQRSDGSQVVNTATASGGFNIATAEVCGTFDGGWDKC